MKKICFTTLVGLYDALKDPRVPNPDWEFICFTNQDITSKVWNIVKINGENPKKLSRKYKIPNLFPEYDLSLYTDASFRIRGDLNELVKDKTQGIWLNRHPQRQCAYEEAEIVKRKKLDEEPLINKQITRYHQEGFPEQYGLWRCGILIRNPKDERVTELCKLWWDEVENGSYRDQISFPYACFKTGVTPNEIPHGQTNHFLKQSLHKTFETDDWKVVGEIDKNLTKKYPLAHLILTDQGMAFPQWLSNYISLEHGRERFEELVKILRGTVVYG